VRNCGGSTLTFWNSVVAGRLLQHVGWSGKLWTKQSRLGLLKVLRSGKPLDLWSENPQISGRKALRFPVRKPLDLRLESVWISGWKSLWISGWKVFESPVGPNTMLCWKIGLIQNNSKELTTKPNLPVIRPDDHGSKIQSHTRATPLRKKKGICRQFGCCSGKETDITKWGD